MKRESASRSALKSIVWRLTGVAILAIITYVYTRNLITTGLVTFIHHGLFLFIFYGHERLWLKVKRVSSLQRRSLMKMFTYETLCGNIVLGSITFLVTGSVTQMTRITLTYIGLKHIFYIINEFIWERRYHGK